MLRTIVTTTALALGLAAFAGCDAEQGTRGSLGGGCIGAKCDAAQPGGTGGAHSDEHPEYREAVDACQEEADRLLGHTNSERYEAVAGIEHDRTQCLADANDEIVPVIEDVANARDESVDDLTADVGRYRDARDALCSMLVDASEQAVTKEAPVSLQTCQAQTELDLADLVGAYADLGVEAVEIPESRVRYPDCWSSYDDAHDGAQLASQERSAVKDLLSCISAANDDARDELVTMTKDQFPGRTDDTLLDDTRRAVRSHANAVEATCQILTTAGPTVSSSEVELAQLQCQVAGLSMVGDLGNLLVPGVWPEGDETDTQDHTSDDGSGTGTGG